MGVYRSTKAGSSWTLLSGGPSPAADYVLQRIAITTTSAAFITYAKKANWNDPQGGIYKYSGSRYTSSASTTTTPIINRWPRTA